MQHTKMSRTEVVRRAYSLASIILTARADDGTLNEVLATDEGLSTEDAGRIEDEVRKIGERLHRHTYNLADK